ncbi:ABC transporter substrate-binding protein [Natronospora cellulosivora (SeqCode)]
MKFSCKLFFVLMMAFVLSVATIAAVGELPREETLVYGGGEWGPPSSFNPAAGGGFATGTEGLLYEPLFHFDPLANEYTPWLAETGEWISDTQYKIVLRDGITWSDGVALTAEDVAFTWEVALEAELAHMLSFWDWTEEIEVVDELTAIFHFSDNPRYQAWNQALYDQVIFPKHVFGEVDDLLVWSNYDDPVGSGPYLLESVEQDRFTWVRDDDWWGNDVHGQPAPKYLVNRIVFSNNVVLGSLMKGEIDLSNFFLPGIPGLRNTFGVDTYYNQAPYHVQWNTAHVFLNTTRKPFDDTNFRRAIAFAMDSNTIVRRVYENMVTASNPTGLFGPWLDFYDADVAEEYGFYYDLDKAAELLDEAGYVDTNGDGWRNAPDGSDIAIDLIVPNGWTDWMEASRAITAGLRAAGINAVSNFPDHGTWQNQMTTGNFNMVINNWTDTSASPYTFWSHIVGENITSTQIWENFGRYDDQELFDAVSEFSYLSPDDPEAQVVASFIQQRILEEMPVIPLWHNGLWAANTTANWTNWPSEDNPTGIACSWSAGWNLGFIRALIELEPAN